MSFHRFVDRAGVIEAFQALGFEGPEEAARFRSADLLYRHLLDKAGGDSTGPQFRELAQRYRKARHLAGRLEGAGRDLVGLHDPATSMLRHAGAPAIRSPLSGDVLADSPVRYVRPDSIQSSQSPAAYLAWLYHLAKAEITPALRPFELDRRRPDLKDLVLSRDHLDLEITTLRLANEILTAQLVDNAIACDEASLIEALKKVRHPFAMPFDRDNATVREALAAMGGLSLNAVAERGREDAFAPGVGEYTLVANPADRLRLYDEHVAMLSERPDTDGTLYSVWYGLPEGVGNAGMQYADVFTAAAGLTFQELEALLGVDRPVVGEDGRAYPGAYIDFSGSGWWEFSLSEDANRRYRTRGRSEQGGSWRALVVRQHQLQNVVIRLKRRTGLAFHRLDWLLQAAFHGHPTNDRWTLLGNGTALNVLAHYVEWRERHGVGVDEFAALLRRINYYHREGSGETSLMRALFGADAAEVTRRVREEAPDAVRVGDLEGEGEAGHLGAVLRRGLKLSRAQWDALLAATGAMAGDPFDGVLLGRVYRLARVFRLMGWGVEEGVELVGRVDPALLDTLATSNLCNDVLRALDRVSWLARWMEEAQLTAAEVMTVLTAPEDAVLHSNRDILNWVLELQQGVQRVLVRESDFGPYTQWRNTDGGDETIKEREWVEGLQEAEILDGEDRGLMMTGERDAVAAATIGILEARSVDLEDDGQSERAEELIDRLVARQGEQTSILGTQATKRSEWLSEGAVPALLRWMGSGPYEALSTLLDWETGDDPGNRSGLELLFDIHRHALVADKLRMDVSEVELAAGRPSWIAVGMGAALTLKQVYLLRCFKTLQNARVSANDWLAYFAEVEDKVPGGDPGAGGEEGHEWLARLLEWPAGEIALLAVGGGIGIENGRVATVEQAEFVARRIALCRDAALGAQELIAVESVSGEDPDWAAARAAARVGLGRFEDGAHAGAAEGRVDEELRDALVGLYLTRVAAADEDLRAFIATDENLYEYLLLDVKVSATVPTTRLLEATGSMQLYVNRALQNVEDAAFEDRPGLAAAWETGGQYRLWEANEKLKLYPSNFIEPELRQGKTGLFRELDARLSQGDIDEDAVEAAVHGYVTGLQRLSELRPHGFFFTRNVERTVYYFTARAPWEKHGYYYRALEIDRLRLEDGSRHAYDWGDWTKAELPVAAEHVYGIVPAFAWNRLFLFWLEMQEEEVTDDEHNRTAHYRLRPKFSRRNLDGSFTDPWHPALGEGVDLEVTALVGEDGPGAYRPLVYQPYYDRVDDRIVFFFVTDPHGPSAQAAGKEATRFVWTLAGSASRNVVEIADAELEEPARLAEYASVPHSLVNVEPRGGGMFPPVLDDSGYAARAPWSGAALLLDHFSWTLSLQAATVAYRWSAARAGWNSSTAPTVLERIDAVVRINGDEVARHRISDGAPGWFQDYLKLETIEDRATIDSTAPVRGLVEVIVESTMREDAGSGAKSHVDEHRLGSTYVLEDDYVSHLFHGEPGSPREAEHYLLTEERDVGTFVAGLSSTGTQAFTGLVYPGYDIVRLFSLGSQQPVEEGVGHFLEQVEAWEDPEYGEVQAPRPRDRLDFDGPFGIYAWELFLHVPLAIAARYRAAGSFAEARKWLRTVYDPQAETGKVWGVWPLLPRLAGDSRGVADPDRIAVEQPAHYRLAAIRQSLRIMTDLGDAEYRRETAEALRLARMWYVSARNLFLDEAGDTFARSLREDWGDPRLGKVRPEDFRPPYNEALRAGYELLEERLDNLRNWRSIDGEPLSVPLVAAAIAPRQLQMAVLSGSAPSDAAAMAQRALPYSFDTALAKARDAVGNLMYFGDLLTRGLYRSDELALEELHARQAHHIAGNLEVAGQVSLIESMKKERSVLEKDKEEAAIYLWWRSRFAGEHLNPFEISAHAALGLKGVSHALASVQSSIAGGLRLLPTIFGFSFGGTEPEAVPEAAAFAFGQAAEAYATMAEAMLHQGESLRRAEENQMERNATTVVVRRIAAEIARLDYDIGEEQGTLEELKVKAANAEAMIEFHRRRTTNREFREWYLGRIASLYETAYDITLRFCRLAERAYQVEVGDPGAGFIRPAWDAQHRGLLAGQSLMLDLQRMDFAFMDRYEPEAHGRLRVALGELDPGALEALKKTGRALFTIGEGRFDEALPDEYGRRIKSVRVRLRGLPERSDIGGRLVLLAHRVYLDRGKSDERSVFNLFARQRITLSGAETDTAEMNNEGGRFRPFERCGVHSTWMLSIPAAVKAIEDGRRRSRHLTALEKLEDVVIDIRYTART